MEITPSAATLGAFVEDVDLSEIDSDTFSSIEAAWHEHAVLIFRGQSLSDEAHLTFSRRLGRLEMGLRRHGPQSGLARIANVDADGNVVAESHLAMRFQKGNMVWHSDSSYKRIGAKASLLLAHQVPTTGGETEWADQRAAYDALGAEEQAWLEDKVAVHSYRYSHTWHGGLEIVNEDDLELLPPVEHPVVKVHPATGRKNLFVGRHASHILGEDEETSRARLKRLTEFVGQPPRTLKHVWQPGDLALWDNRCVLHRGHPWPTDQPRIMVRTTVAGDADDNEWAMQEAANA